MSDSFWEREFEEHQQDDVPTVWLDEPEEEISILEPEATVSTDVISLLNLGQLTHTVDIRGHRIVLRTLKMGEELEIATFIQPYMGSIDEGRALATATVAASIVSFDNQPLIRASGPNENTLRRKFDKVRETMYWPVIKLLYEEGYIPLLDKQTRAVEEFQKK